MNQKEIGKFILKLRTEKNLSQYQLADMIPISRQAVSKWERGESIPDSPALLRLSEIFKVTINELLIGKRLKTNSIKQLENTTLNIIDENNKRTKKLKRKLFISVTIITILILGFLSYYFINSYNQTKVYMISGHSNSFRIRNGIYLTTRGKNYLKIGNIEYDENIEIKNIKFYYKKNNKENIIVGAKDLENFIIMDLEGYYENFSNENKKYLLNNSYIDITYNDNITETLKLKFKRDFTNSNIFFSNKISSKMKVSKVKKVETKTAKVMNEIPEEKVESKPIIIKENIQSIKEEMSHTENASEVLIHDSSLINNITPEENNQTSEKISDNTLETPKEEIFDISKVLENIRNKGFLYNDAYMYANDDESVVIFLFEELGKINTYINDEFAWDYFYNEDRYNCSLNYKEDCKSDIIKTLKEYLYEGGN